VLLTGKAIAVFDRDIVAAKAASMEANRLAPDLVPAAATLAKCLFKNGDLRKGSGVIEAAWKIAPHPELAELYAYARPGDTAPDRLKRARKLASVNAIHPDAHLALARALFDAKEYGEARREAEAALTLRPSEGTYLLLADVEQAESGSQGNVKSWLSKAVRAEPDPAWTADGMVSATWVPMSPVTGRLDAFEWRTPMGRVQPLIEERVFEPEPEQEAAESAPEPVPAPIPAAPSPVMTDASAVEAPLRSQPAATDRLQFPPDDPGVKAEYLNGRPKSRFRLF
jgi:HemY protein